MNSDSAVQTPPKARWGEIVADRRQERQIDEECRHDDSSIRSFNMREKAGIVGYILLPDGVYIPGPTQDEYKRVGIQDPENIELYINVYEIHRCYGGPEEGGWYYDAFECVHSVLVFWEKEEDGGCPWHFFQKQVKRFERRFSNEDRRPLHSVLSDGIWNVRLELLPKESETTEHPYYC